MRSSARRPSRTLRPPLPAKLSPPRLAAGMKRPRLFRLLDRAARRPVIWIEGPAGSGKTTLAATWLARRRGRALWFQVDARDRDPATFFYFLREAVRRAAPRRRETLPLLTPEYLPGLADYSRNFFDGVFARLGAPAVLVLDDYQELPDDSALHRLLPQALGAIPDGVHVVVLSRTPPPPELARLRANSLVSTVGWDALRFTPREAAGLLAEHGLVRPPASALTRLNDEAGGWAAGLVLLGEARLRGRGAAAAGEGRRPAELFDYFASELFARAEPPVQRLLLATSLVPAVTPALAEGLAGEGAAARLERLARQSFFTTRGAGTSPVYQFHPLFRDFLRARAEATLAPAERAELQRRAAALLDLAGQHDDALALLLAAGDGPAAAALLRRLAPTLEAQGRHQALEASIRALPEAVREGDPWLVHWLGACRMLLDPAESLALHRRAFAAFQASGDDAGSLSAAARALEAIFYGFSDMRQADPWLRWAEERLRAGRDLPSPELRVRLVSTFASGLHWRQPSHPELGAWMERLDAMLRQAPVPLRARELGVIAWYRALTGDTAALGSTLRELARACAAPGIPALTRIAAVHPMAACTNFVTAEPDAVLALAREGLALADREGIHALDHFLHAHAASAHLSRGDHAAAGPHLDALRHATRAGPTTDAHHLLLEGWRAHLAGDSGEAVAHVRRALELVEASGFALPRMMGQYLLAQLLRARGDLAGAARLVAEVEAAAGAARFSSYLWACRLARAQLALDAGDRATCRAVLAEALRDGRQRGFTTVPWWTSARVLSGLCEEALEAGIEPEYVRRLIRLHDLVPDPARPGTERWPFPVRIRALGGFVVEREGAPAPLAGRSRPLELLKALVALGGRDVPEDRLVELLWPDAEGDLGRQRLKYTLHALRKLLGPEDVLSLERGLLSLEPRRVWLDAWDLGRHLDQLAEALERRRLDALADPVTRALTLCRGPLLEGESSPWAVGARERLRTRLVRVLAQAAELVAGREPAAAGWVERALELFPGDDRLGRALLRARGP